MVTAATARTIGTGALNPQRLGGGGSAAAIAARGHVLFRQSRWGYLLPAPTLISVLDRHHLQPLPVHVEGWAGTVAMRGGALPVLDAASLLGHGGAATVTLLLRVGSTQTGWAPLGLAVQRLDGLQAIPAESVTPLALGTGLAGGVDAGGQVFLALDPAHLGQLRRAAVALDPAGQPIPQSVAWSWRADMLPTPTAAEGQRFRDSLRTSEPVLLLEDHLVDRPTHALAVPLRFIREVRRATEVRPGPPTARSIAGYVGWQRHVVPVIDLGRSVLGAYAKPPAYEVLLALEGGRIAIALQVGNVRNVQYLSGVDLTPTVLGSLVVLGETATQPIALLNPDALIAALRRSL